MNSPDVKAIAEAYLSEFERCELLPGVRGIKYHGSTPPDGRPILIAEEYLKLLAKTDEARNAIELLAKRCSKLTNAIVIADMCFDFQNYKWSDDFMNQRNKKLCHSNSGSWATCATCGEVIK